MAKAGRTAAALAAVERAVAAATAAGVRYLTLLLFEPAADEAVWSALAWRAIDQAAVDFSVCSARQRSSQALALSGRLRSR